MLYKHISLYRFIHIQILKLILHKGRFFTYTFTHLWAENSGKAFGAEFGPRKQP